MARKLVNFNISFKFLLSLLQTTLLASFFYSCFRDFYGFYDLIGPIYKITVQRYWIVIEIALYKYRTIIIIIIRENQ